MTDADGPDAELDDDLDDDAGFPGQLGGLLEQAMQLQSQLAEAQAQVIATEVEGSSGGGMVRVVMTGGMEVRSVHIDPACVDPAEVEVLEDLVLAALRDAAAEVARVASGATSGLDMGGLAESLGLGGGMSGLGGGSEDLGGGLGDLGRGEPEG